MGSGDNPSEAAHITIMVKESIWDESLLQDRFSAHSVVRLSCRFESTAYDIDSPTCCVSYVERFSMQIFRRLRKGMRFI
ncbi:hypothetical protein K0M31_016521 [Melipona bicolor]|uniref:Uncharacterized protein n=1 Tax=Melipona bicolor TaxID=60889 RepID=A0AA40KEK2_9HYME|nr:hypothetical protein K0M31_016521 [Melipona bicolor]